MEQSFLGITATSSGAHYALCALGVGLIALGIVMIVWTVIPFDGKDTGKPPTNPADNSTVPIDENEEEIDDRTKSSSVAMVLVGVGGAMLLLSICLGVRSKRRARNQRQTGRWLDEEEVKKAEEHVNSGEAVSRLAAYNVPSYEEAVGSGNYPVRQSNLRNSMTHLPSYEDIITPLNVSRLLQPLRVRRIKSDKLHLKDFRLQIRHPTTHPVTIEPITPPPGYENKMPELNQS
uniref:Uncharacterized protein n=1 Tax=Periophthalmus magnuspinnatus TaxID=409849 RepID=A0A3B3ZPD3_9GOBI